MIIFFLKLALNAATDDCTRQAWTSRVNLSGRCHGSKLLIQLGFAKDKFRTVELECLLIDRAAVSPTQVVESPGRYLASAKAPRTIECTEKSMDGVSRLFGTVRIRAATRETLCEEFSDALDNVDVTNRNIRRLVVTLMSDDHTSLQVQFNITEHKYTAHLETCDEHLINLAARRKLSVSDDNNPAYLPGMSSNRGFGRYGFYVNCNNGECPKLWNDCWEDQQEWVNRGAMPQVNMVIFIEDGFRNRYESTEDCIQDVIGMVADSNRIFEPQLYIHVHLELIVLPAAFEAISSGTGRCTYGSGSTVTIQMKLESLRAIEDSEDLKATFKKITNRDLEEFGIHHILTDCYTIETEISLDLLDQDPRSVGLAYPKRLCKKNPAGVTTFNRDGKTWKTLAHEVGHTMGADHSFDELMRDGELTKIHYGGIMDYGDGKLNGVFQFNDRRKEEICTILRGFLNNQVSSLGFGKLDGRTCFTEYYGHSDAEFRWSIAPSDASFYPESCTSAPLRFARHVACINSRTGSWVQDYNCNPEERPITTIIYAFRVTGPAPCQVSSTCGNGILELHEQCDDPSDPCCENCSLKTAVTGCDFLKVTGAFVLLDSLFVLHDSTNATRWTPAPKLEHLRSTNPDTNWPKSLNHVISDTKLLGGYRAGFGLRNGNVYFFGDDKYVVFDHHFQRIADEFPRDFESDFKFSCPDMQYAYHRIVRHPKFVEKVIFRCGDKVYEYTFNGPAQLGRGQSTELNSTQAADYPSDAVAVVEIPESWEIPAPSSSVPTPSGRLMPSQMWIFRGDSTIEKRVKNVTTRFIGPRSIEGMSQGRMRCKNATENGPIPYCKVCGQEKGTCAQCEHHMLWEQGQCIRLDVVNAAEFSKYPVVGARKEADPERQKNFKVAQLHQFELAAGEGVMHHAIGRCEYKRSLGYERTQDVLRNPRAIMTAIRDTLFELFDDKAPRVTVDILESNKVGDVATINVTYTLILHDACVGTMMDEEPIFKTKLLLNNDFASSVASPNISISVMSHTSSSKVQNSALQVESGSPVHMAKWVPQGGMSQIEQWQLSMWLKFNTHGKGNLFRIHNMASLIATIESDRKITLSLALAETTVFTFAFSENYQAYLHEWIQISVRVDHKRVTMFVNSQRQSKPIGDASGTIELDLWEIGPRKNVAQLAFPSDAQKSVEADGMNALVANVVLLHLNHGNPYLVNPIPLLPAITSGVIGALVLIFAFVNLFGYQLRPPKIE